MMEANDEDFRRRKTIDDVHAMITVMMTWKLVTMLIIKMIMIIMGTWLPWLPMRWITRQVKMEKDSNTFNDHDAVATKLLMMMLVRRL